MNKIPSGDPTIPSAPLEQEAEPVAYPILLPVEARLVEERTQLANYDGRVYSSNPVPHVSDINAEGKVIQNAGSKLSFHQLTELVQERLAAGTIGTKEKESIIHVYTIATKGLAKKKYGWISDFLLAPSRWWQVRKANQIILSYQTYATRQRILNNLKTDHAEKIERISEKMKQIGTSIETANKKIEEINTALNNEYQWISNAKNESQAKPTDQDSMEQKIQELNGIRKSIEGSIQSLFEEGDYKEILENAKNNGFNIEEFFSSNTSPPEGLKQAYWSLLKEISRVSLGYMRCGRDYWKLACDSSSPNKEEYENLAIAKFKAIRDITRDNGASIAKTADRLSSDSIIYTFILERGTWERFKSFPDDSLKECEKVFEEANRWVINNL